MLHSTLTTGVPGSSCASSCVGTPLWAPVDGGGRSRSVDGCSSSPLDRKRETISKALSPISLYFISQVMPYVHASFEMLDQYLEQP
ncbi:hypothetical protein XENOCAPTIV_006767 [Xenoophorus captivus]|uniref:Uncharacterized protein n=1 Tax=Xenoophorus captivus TaxID=1517983 RepID=A0ABV0QGW7_9TELE